MPHILVVEDEADLQELVAWNLRQAGYTVDAAERGFTGLELARKQPPDLVILDVMLPDVPGTEVCKLLRALPATADVPVVLLTARADEIDRVVGFELGADDFVPKPFSVRELVLRVKAILRRRRPPEAARLTFGLLEVDREAHRAWVAGAEIELTALELKLLLTLYDRRGRVQSRAALLSDVWEVSAAVTTRTVDTHVKRLREKLGDARDYIETVRGAGYRFTEQA